MPVSGFGVEETGRPARSPDTQGPPRAGNQSVEGEKHWEGKEEGTQESAGDKRGQKDDFSGEMTRCGKGWFSS